MKQWNLFKVFALAASALAALLGVPRVAHANQYGQLYITKNTTLTDDRYGAVIFNANNITLDCNGHQVHFSSYTRLNCAPDGVDKKCGIVVAGKTGVTIKNCTVTGAYDFGVDVELSTNTTLNDVVAQGGATGFSLTYNTGLTGDQLSALNTTGPGLRISHDDHGYYHWVATSPTGGSGISIDNSQWSVFDSSTIGFASWGIESNYNDSILFSAVDVESCQEGYVDFGSTGMVVDNSSFRGNLSYGMYIGGGLNNTVSNSYASNNNLSGLPHACDVYEDTSTGSFWFGDLFSTWCGTVPANH